MGCKILLLSLNYIDDYSKGNAESVLRLSSESVPRLFRVRNLSYDYFEFGICPMPEFGICPTIIPSSESVLCLSSGSVLRLFRVFQCVLWVFCVGFSLGFGGFYVWVCVGFSVGFCGFCLCGFL